MRHETCRGSADFWTISCGTGLCYTTQTSAGWGFRWILPIARIEVSNIPTNHQPLKSLDLPVRGKHWTSGAASLVDFLWSPGAAFLVIGAHRASSAIACRATQNSQTNFVFVTCKCNGQTLAVQMSKVSEFDGFCLPRTPLTRFPIRVYIWKAAALGVRNSDMLQVIVSLRNPGLRERHWPVHPASCRISPLLCSLSLGSKLSTKDFVTKMISWQTILRYPPAIIRHPKCSQSCTVSCQAGEQIGAQVWMDSRKWTSMNSSCHPPREGSTIIHRISK